MQTGDWVFFFAVYFVAWWIVLFAVLPFAMRSQDEGEDGATLGSTHSAPEDGRRHVLRAMFWTTVVTAVLMLIWLGVSLGFDIRFDDLLPGAPPQF